MRRDAAALAQQWPAVGARLQSSVAVRAAYIGALCACGVLGEAAAALHRMLDLYAVLYGRRRAAESARARTGAVPDLAAQEALRPLPRFCGAEGLAAVAATGAQQGGEAAGSLQAAADAAAAAVGCLGQLGEAAGDPSADVRVDSSSGRQEEAGSSTVQEPVLDSPEEAARAAAQACHQVIHAAGRAGAADVAHEAALAMHEARSLSPPPAR
jgi:hypothetical protein